MRMRWSFAASIAVSLAVGVVGACHGRESEPLGEAGQALTCVTFQRGISGTVADATIEQAYSTWNQGTNTTLWTGRTSGVQARTLLRFDLSSIPAGSTITSATASIYVAAAQTTTVRAHRVTSPWSEQTVTWSNFGAAFDPSVAGSFQTGGYLTRTFDLTSLVAAWVGGSSPNDGWLLEEDGAATKTGYASSESSTVARRPALTVCYEPPGATGAGGAGATGAATNTTGTTNTTTNTTGTTSTTGTTNAAASTTGSTTSSTGGATSSSASGGGVSESVRIAVIGDSGAEGSGLDDVAAMVVGWNPDQVLTVGDNVYSNLVEPYDPIIGKHYHSFIGGYAGAWGAGSETNRFWPILGNHDYDHLAAYLAFFTLPNGEHYYDTFVDPAERVHLFALIGDDREPDGNTSTSVQAQWFRARSAADTSSCFKIVTEHEPPYCSTIGQSEGPDATVQWPYHAWGADLVMSGSRHGYERLANDGIPYIVNGLGGGALWGDWNIIDPHSVYRFPTTPQRHGALLLTVTVGGGTATLRGEFYGVSTGGVPDAAPADVFTITKPCL